MRRWLSIMVALVAGQVLAGDIPKELQGVWKVAVEPTIAEFKLSPRYQHASAADKERLPDMVAKMREMLTLFIDDSTMAMVRGTKKRAATLTLQQGGEGKWVFSASKYGQEVVLTFEQRPEGRILFTSSATNDLDSFVWQRLTPEEIAAQQVTPEQAQEDAPPAAKPERRKPVARHPSDPSH